MLFYSLASGDDCQEAEDDAKQHEVVARRMRMLDDPVARHSKVNQVTRKLYSVDQIIPVAFRLFVMIWARRGRSDGSQAIEKQLK